MRIKWVFFWGGGGGECEIRGNDLYMSEVGRWGTN